jgi:hypothetical protein
MILLAFKAYCPKLGGQSDFRIGSKNLSAYVETYDWVYDFGRNNIQTWIERAAIRAGR